MHPFVLPKKTSSRVVHIQQMSAYPELARFRQKLLNMETASLARPHAYYRRKSMLYRSSFIGFSAVFFSLFLFLLFHKASLFGANILPIGIAMKATGCTFSFIMGLIALAMGCSISADREAVSFIWRQERFRLKRLYSQKRLKYGWKSFLPPLASSPLALLMDEFHHALEKMDEIKEHTRFLLRRLRQTELLDIKARDRVRNQALLDMQEQLRAIVHSFQKSQ